MTQDSIATSTMRGMKACTVESLGQRAGSQMDARRKQQARVQAGKIRKGAQLHIKRLAQEQLVRSAC